MVDSGYTNNIFFITDQLEMFAESVEKESGHYNFCRTALDNLADSVKQRQKKNKMTSKNYYAAENNLVVINRKFYQTNLKSVTENLFLANFNHETPHFLFLTLNPETRFDTSNLDFDADNFFYNVTPDEEASGRLLVNEFFLSLIFRCIANRKRVQNYIVNTFQTIVESTIINKQKLQIEKLYGELEAVSKVDSLTNVLSRKAFFDAMELERARTQRESRRLKDCTTTPPQNKPTLENITQHYGHFSCLMIDFDNFKQINDQYGHLIGDNVLKKMGELLNSGLIFRESDIIGRYGGEEFIAILPETNAEHAFIPAERLRSAIEQIEFSSNKGTFHVTICIGISEFEPGDSCDSVIRKADTALYTAKEQNKNRVTIYGRSRKNVQEI